MASKKHYTEVDKKTFLGIVKKFSHIIENKKSDSSTLKNKEDAWKEITEQYNISAVISSKRNVTQLKKMWSNMKYPRQSAIMKNEEELFNLKLRHEELKNKLEIEFLRAKYALEIRAAAAAAEKAELQLKQQQEVSFHHNPSLERQE